MCAFAETVGLVVNKVRHTIRRHPRRDAKAKTHKTGEAGNLSSGTGSPKGCPCQSGMSKLKAVCAGRDTHHGSTGKGRPKVNQPCPRQSSLAGVFQNCCPSKLDRGVRKLTEHLRTRRKERQLRLQWETNSEGMQPSGIQTVFKVAILEFAESSQLVWKCHSCQA